MMMARKAVMVNGEKCELGAGQVTNGPTNTTST